MTWCDMSAHWLLFQQMFAQAVRAIKAQYPHIKVGGPAFGIDTEQPSSQGPPCTKNTQTNQSGLIAHGEDFGEFIDKLVTHELPIDFISFHGYSNDPTGTALCGRAMRALMPAAWELHITEWNMQSYGPYNTTAASAITTSTWIGMQDYADVSTMYYGCCAEFPYMALGLGGEGTGMGVFAANASLPWKPQALAFALWHNFTAFENRAAVVVAGDATAPLAAVAGRNAAGSVGLLLANPTNRSVEVLLRLTDSHGQSTSNLCSPSAQCEVQEIVDESGRVRQMALQSGSTTVVAWGVALIVKPG